MKLSRLGTLATNFDPEENNSSYEHSFVRTMLQHGRHNTLNKDRPFSDRLRDFHEGADVCC